ncbi:MAG TPA: hypothetical protein VMF89_15630, partial [Polyangiales bacterium]|nr:hypothetical protein [Polyangiales bacterium]
SRAEIFAKVLTARPERLDVSPALEAVVLKGLARERADRYASANAFAVALSQCERPRSRVGSRAAHVIAAVSGVALLAMPTHLMHAAPPLVENEVVKAETPVAETSEPPAPQPDSPPQPSAASEKAEPQQPKVTLPRARTRAPRPTVDSPTNTAVDEVKLMSW